MEPFGQGTSRGRVIARLVLLGAAILTLAVRGEAPPEHGTGGPDEPAVPGARGKGDPAPAPAAPAKFAFPCAKDLNADKTKEPTLQLVSREFLGGAHNDDTKAALKSAAAGKIALAIDDPKQQGAPDLFRPFPVPNPKKVQLAIYDQGYVSGLNEAALYYTSTMLLLKQIEDGNKTQQSALNNTKFSLVEFLRDGSYKIEAWQAALKSKGLSRTATKFMEQVGEMLKVRENDKDWTGLVEKFEPTAKNLNNDAWREVIYAYAVAYGKLNDGIKGPGKIPDMTPYDKVIDNPLEEKFAARYRTQIFEGQGLRTAADAIAKLYCDSRKGPADTVAVVPHAYAQALMEVLRGGLPADKNGLPPLRLSMKQDMNTWSFQKGRGGVALDIELGGGIGNGPGEGPVVNPAERRKR